MNIEEIRLHCLSKPETSEAFPFDEDTLVFKVMGKMFALMSLTDNDRMNLKCDPERAIELREHHDGEVIPGWHMNKKHWNTVYFNGTLSDAFLREQIDHSYEMVVKSLKKADREHVESML